MKDWRIDEAEAERLCCIKQDDTDASIARNHLIALFNFLENIAMAYEQHVVDRSATEDTLGPVISDVFVFFQPFVDKMRNLNRSEPWPPLSRVVAQWLNAARIAHHEEESHKLKKNLDDAIEKANRNRPPMGT